MLEEGLIRKARSYNELNSCTDHMIYNGNS